MDIFEEARRFVGKSLIELYFNSAKSYWEKGEFWTLSPLRNDNKIGSFSISESGFYKDFASDDKGDFINLVERAFNITNKQSAEKIIHDSGGIIPEKTYMKKEKKLSNAVKIDKALEISTKDKFKKAVQSDHNIKDRNGIEWDAVKSYYYREYKTKLLLFYIIRYENEIDGKKEKKFSPFHLDNNNNIVQKMPTNLKPYPLYRINSIIDNEYPVLIVEGEKCADVKIPGYNIITYSGGVNNIQNFNFEPIKKRDIFIFPDNDKQEYKKDHKKAGEIMPLKYQPGYKAALKIKTDYLPQSIILNISKLNKPEKWDIADAEVEGLNLVDLIESLKPDELDYPPIDPFYAYKQFISKLYGEKNLIQIDGVMWKYSEKDHYWKQFKKENLQVDFQIWMEKSGAITILDSMDKSKHSYKSQAISFLNNHGLEFYTDNHFKYSAISPYIHFKNGAIEIMESGYKFHPRKENDEDFYRNIYPVSCFDYKYKEKDQGKITFKNIKKYAPLFCYFIDSIIPEKAKKDKYEVENTYRFVLQMIAYSMSPIKPGEYFFGFYGGQGSAKTSLFRLVSLFIGEDFMSIRPFRDFENNRFATSELWGTKIYCDNDVAENMSLPDDFIKNNSGNNTITVEQKHQSPIKGVRISITMFFVSNYEFKTTGVEGIDRRAIIVKFENSIPEKKRDRLIMDRICGIKKHDSKTPEFDGEIFDERPSILNLIMDSWDEFIENSNMFIIPEWIKESSDKLKAHMGSIGSFFYQITEDEIENLKIKDKYKMQFVYDEYKAWCKDEGRYHKRRNKFYEDFERSKHTKYFVERKRESMGEYFYIREKQSEEISDSDIENLIF